MAPGSLGRWTSCGLFGKNPAPSAYDGPHQRNTELAHLPFLVFPRSQPPALGRPGLVVVQYHSLLVLLKAATPPHHAPHTGSALRPQTKQPRRPQAPLYLAPPTERSLAWDPRVLVLVGAGHCPSWVLVWTGACYWHGVGGFMFNSSSSPQGSPFRSSYFAAPLLSSPAPSFFTFLC